MFEGKCIRIPLTTEQKYHLKRYKSKRKDIKNGYTKINSHTTGLYSFKRPVTLWKKTFTSQIADTGLVPNIYKKRSVRKRQTIQEKKVNKGYEHTFIKENCNDQ